MKNHRTLILIFLILAACGKKDQAVHPTYREITQTVFASGFLEPEGMYQLTSQTEGYITNLSFTEGELVEKGQVLCTVDNRQNLFNDKSAEELYQISKFNTTDFSPQIQQTEVAIRLATDKLNQEEIQLTRYRNLLATKSVSSLEFENVGLAYASAKANLESLHETLKLHKQQAGQQLIIQESQKNVNGYNRSNNYIRVPQRGKVFRKFKESGDYVRKGEVIAQIGNPDLIYARLNVDESNIALLKKGQKAHIQLNTLRDSVFEGEVSEILPAFEESTQSFIARVTFLRKPSQMLSGTQLQANLIVGSKSKALVIPRQYLDFGNKVFVKGQDNPVLVETGFVSTEWVEIRKGLTESQEMEIRNK